MSADETRDLLMSLLAMDSYNRGYDSGLDYDLNQIGSAGFETDSSIKLGENTTKSAGFYAAAYDLPDGATVIAYRGTDELELRSSANDIVNGWAIGAGAQTGQSIMALDFNNKVTGKSVYETNAANVVLTGHSLGG